MANVSGKKRNPHFSGEAIFDRDGKHDRSDEGEMRFKPGNLTQTQTPSMLEKGKPL
jgi:hypothetical protein